MKKKYFSNSKLVIVFCILSLVLQVLAVPKVHANTAEEDMIRRRLFMFGQCLNNFLIHTNRDYNTLEDMFTESLDGGKNIDMEVIVSGLDIDSDNGVITCRTAIREGVEIYTHGSISAGDQNAVYNWLMAKVTGGKNIENNDGEKIPKDKSEWDNNLNILRTQVSEAMTRNGGNPSRLVRASRLLPLVTTCYKMSNKPLGTLGANDFKVDGVGYFYLKNADEIQNIFKKWIRLNDGVNSATNAEIGNIELGFSGDRGAFGDFNANNSDFYPIGNDLSATPGMTVSRGGIADCSLVNIKKNPSLAWIFDGTSINDDGSMTDSEGNTISASRGSEGDGDDENKTTCENKGGALGWIVCPVVRMISNALEKVEALIENLLQTNSDKIQKGDDAYKVWLNFRNIAYVGIVIAMLVMIIGTAMDLEIVGAYTVKKVLPRLVISVILISLSWNICLFFIDFADLLGRGMMGIMTAPFGGDSLTLSSSTIVSGGFGWSNFDTFITQIGAGLGIIAILAFFWQVILLFALLTLMVLILRQSIIFLLVVISPIAFVAWIFPGTQRLWKMWSDNFTKLMLMFPMIVALIASGRIFASLIGKGDFSGLTEIIQIVAYMIPYAIIPFTFKFAGSAMAFAGGAIMSNKATQWANKAAMGRGIGKAKRSYERASTGNVFRNAPTGSIRSRINRYAAGAANINKAGLRPSNWRTNMGTFLDDQEVANSIEHAEKDASYQSWKSDDSLNRAALIASRSGRDIREILRERGYAGFGDANVNQDQAEAAIESAARRTERTRKGMNERAFQMMTWQSAVKGGTAYTEEETAQMWADAAGIAGDDDSVLASLVARGRDAAMAGGRVDQGGAGFGVTLNAARALRDETLRPDQVAASIHEGVLNAQSPAVLAHSSMKPQALRALMPMMRERLIQAYNTGDQEVIDRELASIESLQAQFRMAGNVQNTRILEDEVLNWHPTMSALPLPPGVAGPEPPRTPLPHDEYGPAAPSLRATIGSDLQRRRSSPEGAAALEAHQRQQAAQNARGGSPNPVDPMNPGYGN